MEYDKLSDEAQKIADKCYEFCANLKDTYTKEAKVLMDKDGNISYPRWRKYMDTIAVGKCDFYYRLDGTIIKQK